MEAGSLNSMQDAWRAYFELAFGLTEASKKKAKKVAKDLVGKGGATAAQLQSFAEDLVSTSRNNREGLARLVRYEVDRALGALGLATNDEVAELTNRIRDLERQVQETSTARTASAEPAAAKTTTAKKTTAKKTVAKKAVATKAVATKTAANQAPAKQTAAKKATG
jgi:polyhydroxyalkanoate synthesis regulator phasin